MKFRRRAMMLSALVAFIFLACVAAQRTPDPVVNGQRASKWTADLLTTEYQTRDAARSALAKLGEPAVPQIIILLRAKDRPWERYTARIAGVFPFLQRRTCEPGLCRSAAAEMLAILGGAARTAVPDLVESLSYPAAAENAERALAHIGDASINGVLNGLQHGTPEVRVHCARILKTLPHEPRCIVPLAAAARAAHTELRKEAVLTLGEFAVMRERIVPALLELANDDRFEVRAAVCESLGKLHASEALPALDRALHDASPLVQLAAAKAVWELTRNSGAVLPVLISILPTSEGFHSAYTLANIGPEAAPAVPALIDALKREKVPRAFRTPPSSAFALAQIEGAAIPALITVLKDPDAEVRLGAVLAFGMMGRQAHSAVAALEPLLQDPDEEVRHVTAITLATIGADRDVVLNTLADCLRAEDIYMRSTAAALLRQIAPEREWVVAPE